MFEVFYGGARGGGKTLGSILDWLQHSAQYGEDAVGVFFRRTFKQLEEVIAETQKTFPKIGATYNKQAAEWTMIDGGRLKFRYLERDSDADNYQGHSYTRVYFEEAGGFPSPTPINKLRATLRSAKGVPCGMRLTGNPGGPGQNWLRARYIDPAPEGYKVLEEHYPGLKGETLTVQRVFIPSKVSDNPRLIENDPLYIARLRQVGSEKLVQAWLDGNWDAVQGAFFDEWNDAVHVVSNDFLKRIPKNAPRFRAFDWGSSAPFSCGWYVVSDGTWGLPRLALLKYREWYGGEMHDDGRVTGLKMDAVMVARGIKERERGENIQYGVADPSIFIRDGGPSIAELMNVKGIQWRKADNKRIPGWEQMHWRLRGNHYGTPDWQPMLYFVESCQATIRTLPILQHDETKIEDVDTESEDHAGDETRYACMSRPWLKDAPVDIDLPAGMKQLTINEIIAKRTRARRAAESN